MPSFQFFVVAALLAVAAADSAPHRPRPAYHPQPAYKPAPYKQQSYEEPPKYDFSYDVHGYGDYEPSSTPRRPVTATPPRDLTLLRCPTAVPRRSPTVWTTPTLAPLPTSPTRVRLSTPRTSPAATSPATSPATPSPATSPPTSPPTATSKTKSLKHVKRHAPQGVLVA